MLYRIRLEPKGARWVIEIVQWGGLYWRRLTSADGKGTMSFSNYDDAVAFVKERGIDKVYGDRTSFIEAVAYGAAR